MNSHIRDRKTEYAFKHKFEKKGFIVFETMSNKGFADLIAVNPKNRRIYFIQIKPLNYPTSDTLKLEKKFNYMNNEYLCKFIILTDIKKLKGGTDK